ncbi:alpha/beta hydrolase [Nonomuraea sp. NBC_01738]|uniref:alpha/beta fold hydrolase n=1 Tax=Nonomuraea sp. NBC_01738 TaxID=2976003 RepID=UPI002E0EF94F|nr:alpha/beta hydrolase [Nonomuraea sp. NBC_01738]
MQVKRLLRRAVRLLCGLGVLALAPVLGLATLAGMASVTLDPGVFTIAGLAVFACVCYLGLLLCVPRPGARWGRWVRAAGLLGAEAWVVWIVATATLTVPDPAAAGARPVPGQRFWELDTGSRLAYVRAAPKERGNDVPVVVLHGGPGTPDLRGDAAFFGKLAADGYDVYVYDQLGTGRSARLEDPERYGLRRDVQDLEAIRRAVGAEQLTLIGHGSGAQLAAAYLATFPGRVANVVYSSPAPLAPPPAMAVLGRAEPLLEPRALATYTLMRVRPSAARAFAADAELDARLDAQHARLAPALHCAGARAVQGGGAVAPGAGGYASLADRTPDPAVRQALAATQVPTLVIKGECDHQPWSSALDYPRAALAYLPGAGHAAYADRPGPYLRELRAFLSGRPPAAPLTPQPPPGYQGPP